MTLYRKQPAIGLALSGGSTLGIAHIGALKALAEHGIPVHAISGTSAGSLVAALYAFGIPIEQMTAITKDMKWRRLARFARSRMGWASNRGIGALIEQLLGNILIEDAHIPLAIIATNIETGKKRIFQTGSVLEAVRASTSIPGIFTPVELDDGLYVDGGLSENLPLSPLKDMGADILVGINLSTRSKTFRPTNVSHVIKRSVAILSEHQGRASREQAHVLIEPQLNEFSASSFADADRILQAGYEATETAIPLIKESIAAFEARHNTLYHRLKSFFRFHRNEKKVALT